MGVIAFLITCPNCRSAKGILRISDPEKQSNFNDVEAICFKCKTRFSTKNGELIKTEEIKI